MVVHYMFYREKSETEDLWSLTAPVVDPGKQRVVCDIKDCMSDAREGLYCVQCMKKLCPLHLKVFSALCITIKHAYNGRRSNPMSRISRFSEPLGYS